MDVFGKIIHKTAKILSVAAAFALIACMLLVTANVVLRTVLGRPILGTLEWVGFLTAIAIALGLAGCAAAGSHIAIDFVVEKLRPGARRIIAGAATLVSAGFIGALTWFIFIYADKLARSGEVSPTTQVPFYLFVYVVGAGFLALLFVLAVSFVKVLRGAEK